MRSAIAWHRKPADHSEVDRSAQWLIALAILCILCGIVGKASGQPLGQSSGQGQYQGQDQSPPSSSQSPSQPQAAQPTSTAVPTPPPAAQPPAPPPNVPPSPPAGPQANPPVPMTHPTPPAHPGQAGKQDGPSGEQGPFVPSPDQQKDLRISQLEALQSNTVYNARAQQIPEYQAWLTAAQRLPEFQQFRLAMESLNGACQKVKVANKWPVDVQCDPNTNPIQFSRQATTQAAPVQPPPTPSPKSPASKK